MTTQLRKPPDQEFNVVFLDLASQLFLVFCCQDCVEAFLGENTASERVYADDLFRVTGKYCGGYCINCGCEVGGIAEGMEELFSDR